MSRAWFSYPGTGNIQSPLSYTLSKDKPTCINGRIVCAVYGQNRGSLIPGNFSNNLLIYIATGRATGLPQPSTPIGSKKYVYFLPLP